ncbi:MAG TPA: GNAT family N-acetyltransferase [Anaerolineaceae bacterium]|nr:GNAT family N-acetyltransferase [Anaerolineaceae bacterium]
MEFQIFTPHHVDDAATLLVAQSTSMLKRFPLLPERVGNLHAAKIFLSALLEKSEARGMLMLEKNKVVGYLLGYYDDNPFFGRHVWVPFGGTVVPQSQAYGAIRALYAAAGDIWIGDGILNHYWVCPALDDWLKAGFSLSFGQEQVYAVAPLKEREAGTALPAGITMRVVQPGDAQQLAQKGHWIAAHLNGAPVWEPVPPEHLENIRPAYAELANDDTSTTWVALDGEEIVSYVTIYTVDIGAIHYLGSQKAAHFATAATDPAYRARGIGRALATQIFNIAGEQGYETMFTDWRITNLEAARYWPTFGFEPFAYRLLRRVNPRYQRFEMPK